MRILLVEDEPRIARALVRGFTEEGHQIDLCATAEAADTQLEELEYDVVILDWMLPDQDGLSLLRGWRARGQRVPVLMLTARSAVPERIAGLRAGADDYLPKPFAFDELLARVEAIHRRDSQTGIDHRVGTLKLNVRTRNLESPSGQAQLTPREYALCSRFFENPGEVLTRTELLQSVWGSTFSGEPNVVDVYVGYLRKKLEEIAAEDVAIRTVRGVGFKLDVREDS